MGIRERVKTWLKEQKTFVENQRKKLKISAEKLTPEKKYELWTKIFSDRALKVPAQTTFEDLTNEVRELAYAKWEEAGRPEGDGNQFWISAETELFGPNPLKSGGYVVYIEEDDGPCLANISQTGIDKVSKPKKKRSPLKKAV